MVIAGIASIPSRKDMLVKTVQSLLPQVDKVCVALNNYPDIPQELRSLRNVECVIMDNSLGDGAKMSFAEPNVMYCSCDDDIIYPTNYVHYMTSKAKQYNSIVTLHGKNFRNRPLKSYRKGFTLNYHCLHTYGYDVELDVGGSGVMCFDTNVFMPNISMIKMPNMCDIWVSKMAHQQGVKIMGVAHKNNFLGYQNPQETIWNTCRIDHYMTQVLNSFLK